MCNIYAIVILILVDIPRFSVNSLHQNQFAAASRLPATFAGVRTERVQRRTHTDIIKLVKVGASHCSTECVPKREC